MLYLHGAEGYGAYFAKLMRHSASHGFPSYAPDLMGHGLRFEEDIRTASILQYIADIAKFLEEVLFPEQKGRRELIIVGHSMGALMAQKLAEQPYVRATVLITPAPPMGVAFRSGPVKWREDDLHRLAMKLLGGQDMKPDRQYLESFFADPVKSRKAIDQWALQSRNESLFASVEILLGLIGVKRERIKGPILVIGAGRDAVIHPSVAKEVADHYGAKLEMIPELGHMCPFERGCEKVSRSILKWLDDEGFLA